MKKLITLAAASSLALAVAATAMAKETPGLQCKTLTGMAHQRCMRSTVMNKMEDKMNTKVMQMKRMYNKRQLKEVERERQRTGEMSAKAKNMITNSYYSSKAASSAMSSTSSSAASTSSH